MWAPGQRNHAQCARTQHLPTAPLLAHVRYCIYVVLHCYVLCTSDGSWCPRSGEKDDVHTKSTQLMMVYGKFLIDEDAEKALKKPLTAGTYVVKIGSAIELCNWTCDKQFQPEDLFTSKVAAASLQT